MFRRTRTYVGSILTSLVLAIATDASAQEGYSWSGFYLGAHAGYGWGDAEYEHQNINFFGGPGGLYDNEINGAVVGGQLGFNYQIDWFVVGVEGTAAWSDISGNYDFSQYTNDTTTDLEWVVTVAGRLGFALDRFLIYGKGGYAWARAEAGQEYYKPGVERYWSDEQTVSGFLIGGGLEYAVTDNVVAGFEYVYIDFDEERFSGDDSKDVPAEIDGDLDIHQILARLSFKF